MNIFRILENTRVMAIFAHPDDAETAAGGTLALYAQAGLHVHLTTIARGEKGRGDSSDRRSESRKAAEILGISESENLGFNDGEFDNDLDLRKILTERIRAVQPTLVICPDPTAVFFSHAYVNHRDHRQTGWAVLDVVSSAVNNPKYFSASEAHDVEHLICAGTLEPNCAVDISETIETKIDSVLCYESQIGDRREATRESILSGAQAVGHEIGVEYGEAFRYCALSSAADQL